MNIGDEYETDKYLITVDSLRDLTKSCQQKPQAIVPKPQPAFSNKLANSKSRKVCLYLAKRHLSLIYVASKILLARHGVL